VGWWGMRGVMRGSGGWGCAKGPRRGGAGGACGQRWRGVLVRARGGERGGVVLALRAGCARGWRAAALWLVVQLSGGELLGAGRVASRLRGADEAWRSNAGGVWARREWEQGSGERKSAGASGAGATGEQRSLATEAKTGRAGFSRSMGRL
jgi:hypothetical protein